MLPGALCAVRAGGAGFLRENWRRDGSLAVTRGRKIVVRWNPCRVFGGPGDTDGCGRCAGGEVEEFSNMN